jgi:hypothetical protein
VKEDMKATTAFRKTLIAFLTVLTLTGFSFTGIAVSGTGSTNGSAEGEITSFGYNNPTIISGLSIQSGNVQIAAGDLTRANNFNLVFNVEDIDGFDHLDVYVVLYNTDPKNASSGITKTFINSGVSDDALVVRWFSPERSTYLSGLTSTGETFAFGPDITSGQDNFLVKSGANPLDGFYSSGLADFVSTTDFNAQTNVTWVVGASSSTVKKSGLVTQFDEDGNEEFSGLRNIKREVSINFTMSKVAPSAGIWNYAVYVYDRLQQEIDLSNTTEVFEFIERDTVEYVNQFYGEIQITAGNEIFFSGVQAGAAGFFESSGVVTALFIANGDYNQQVKSSTTWRPNVVVAGLLDQAYLIANSGFLPESVGNELLALEGNRFALQAYRVTLSGTGPVTSAVDILPFGTSGDVLPKNDDAYAANRGATLILGPDAIIADDSPTTEAGAVSTFKFQIRLSEVFQTQYRDVNGVMQTTIFTGTLQLIVANKTP